MKKTILALLVLGINTTFASADVSLICISSFNQEVYNLVEQRDATCLADFVWGYKSVCYEGDAEAIVELMNDDYFNTSSMAVEDAVLNKDGSVSYVGLDKRNFFSAKRTLLECSN